MNRHRKERSKLVLPRLAGERDESASIEEHHMQCEKVHDRVMVREEAPSGQLATASAAVRRSFHAKKELKWQERPFDLS